MTTSAWLIPTHPPHFALTAQVLESAREHEIPGAWIPVFTYEAEAAAFVSAYPSNAIHYVVEPLIGPDRVAAALESRSIVNVKKMAALWELKNHFETIRIIDSECSVLRPGDPARSASVRDAERAWPGHPTANPFLRGILKGAVALFDVRDRRQLLERVVTDRWLYTWFEDIPTYRSDDASAMFEYFGADKDVTVFTDALTWESFDHLVYQYFCCLRRGWRLDDAGLPGADFPLAWWEAWRADGAGLQQLAGTHMSRWAPSWVADPGLLDLSPNAFMAFHTDRFRG